MTPKEKAEQLVNSFYYALPNNGRRTGLSSTAIRYKEAKQCALIAVDEILENFGTLTEGKQHYAAYSTIQFYEKVKQEIENIGGKQ